MAGMYAVVIEGEGYPEVVGPFRAEAKADAVAAEWNSSERAQTGNAFVRPMRRKLAEVDD